MHAFVETIVYWLLDSLLIDVYQLSAPAIITLITQTCNLSLETEAPWQIEWG